MKKIAIVGGGASGIACAIKLKTLLGESASVTILEKLPRIGKKILMTGNGKCNISNINLSEGFYNSEVVGEVLKEFDFLKCKEFFEDIGLMLRVDEAGRVYPYSEKATTVLDTLLRKLNQLDVNIITNYDVGEIKKTDKFLVYSNDYQVYNFDYLVMATGGQASINGDYNGYELLERLGHTITNLRPGLVALKTKEDLKPLAGIRIKGRAKIIIDDKLVYETNGEILFKNEGLSGIAILELSRYFQPDAIISIDLVPDMSYRDLHKFFKPGIAIEDVIAGMFPKMVCIDILKKCNRVNEKNIIEVIKDYRFTVIDTYGFNNAQITVGGISINEINPFTLASLIVDDMYIIGEVADIDGTSGGYNLHYAWGSGVITANNIARIIKESEEKKNE